MVPVAALKHARDRLATLVAAGEFLVARAKPTQVQRVRQPAIDLPLVDEAETTKWQANCENILIRLAGERSHYLIEYRELMMLGWHESTVRRAVSVLRALLEDLDGGHLADLPLQVRAEVFADLDDQARQLLAEGHYLPAAVLAGAVLEDALRQLCAKHSIAIEKRTIEPMNVALAKAGAYSPSIQKQVTYLAATRNLAAHGRASEFTPKEVELMLAGVAAFVAHHLN